MCVPCWKRYEMTTRSKSKRGREIGVQETPAGACGSGFEKSTEGLADQYWSVTIWLMRRLIRSFKSLSAYWRLRPSRLGEVGLGDDPPPACGATHADIHPSRSYVQYTVSRCHTKLRGHHPYRRCERNRLQFRQLPSSSSASSSNPETQQQPARSGGRRGRDCGRLCYQGIVGAGDSCLRSGLC